MRRTTAAGPAPEMPARGICAHRGENRVHPENTLAAFREALRLGAHQVEMDIHLTDSGELVVIHDPTLDRTTGSHGEVRRLTRGDIRRLEAGAWKGVRFAGEPVPSADEALAIMPRNAWLNLQPKGGYELGVAMAEKIIAHRRTHQAFLAVKREAAAGARSVSREILVCNLERREGDVDRYVNETVDQGAAFIQLHHRHPMPGDRLVARLRSAGVKINFFGTNEPGALAGLFARGIDFPMVDDLGPMMAAAARLGVEPLRHLY